MSPLTMGVPAKVLRTATAMGMHADCVAAGPDGLCDDCNDVMYDAMDEHYGHHASVTAAVAELLDDLLAGA